MRKHSEHTWYEDVRQYTKLLTSVGSVSPGKGEYQAAGAVLMLLYEDVGGETYTQIGLDQIENDPYERQNVYAFLKGQSTSTIVLLGHFDTVGTQDYGTLESLALEPDALRSKRAELGSVLEGTDPNDWMFGRGVADMKSGVAVNIALMHYFAQYAPDIPLSVLFLATPDEENESAGILQAVHLLIRLREQYNLNYIGAINTDYTTAQYTGDLHRYIYTGTVGKLLPSFLCIGRESHVGTPFNGLDANLLTAELIRAVSMNDELCDVAHGQITAPPVTLRATDLKTHYNVQLPLTAYFYLNVLTFTTTPEALLERLRQYAEMALGEVLGRIDKIEARWRKASGEQERVAQPRTGVVLTYSELYEETLQRLGEQQVYAELDAEWQRCPATLDKRERSLHLVYRLWTLSGRQGPAIVIYYSPPYYPHVASTQGALHDAITKVIVAHPELPLVQQEYFPYLSDLSYLRLDADIDPSTLKANMPIWKEPTAQGTHAGAYCVPLEAIEKLNIPVVNFGVYGQGAHQRDEGVLMSYSFGTLPELLCETIEQLARSL
ncbi:MAG: M20/M25/M40 family metallo-hydrolase [Ktedonobacteraceae bacterium]